LNFTVLAEEKQRNAVWCSNIIHDLEIIQQSTSQQRFCEGLCVGRRTQRGEQLPTAASINNEITPDCFQAVTFSIPSFNSMTGFQCHVIASCGSAPTPDASKNPLKWDMASTQDRIFCGLASCGSAPTPDASKNPLKWDMASTQDRIFCGLTNSPKMSPLALTW
jgi:hypothetical protein